MSLYNLATSPEQINKKDRMYWRLDKKGWFSTSSVMDLITNHDNLSPCSYEWIWMIKTYLKVKKFFWRVASNGLPTKERLMLRRVGVLLDCPLYGSHFEDSPLLTKYPITLKMIERFSRKASYEINKIDITNKKPYEILNEAKSKQRKEEMKNLVFIWWCIWHHINKTIFDHINIMNNEKLTFSSGTRSFLGRSRKNEKRMFVLKPHLENRQGPEGK